MSTHVILGTGTVGIPLAHILLERGHRVIAVNRSGKRHGLPDEVELRSGDLTDPAFAASALEGADVAYQITQPAYHRWEEDFPPLQDAILAAAERTGTAVVLADNLYCYGTPGDTISEKTPELPSTVKGRVRAEMSEKALALHAAGRVRVVLTRPSNYVGADYELSRNMLVKPARAGKNMQVLGRIDQPHSFSYVPDVARAMADIGSADDAWGRAWVLPVLEPLTQRELCQAIWTAAGQPGDVKVSAIRGPLMRVLGIFIAPLRASIEMMDEWEKPFTVDASQFEKRFGWKATTTADAVAATVAGVR